MRNISAKALFCVLLTSLLFFTTNVVSAESKIKASVVAIQKTVDLNKSTLDDLMTLKGIGHNKAKAILAYRKKIGSFKSVSDLTNVKGIGEKILMANKKRIKI